MAKKQESGWNEWSRFVLKELERLNERIGDLYEKHEEQGASKEVLEDIKSWKSEIEALVTLDDLKKMKDNQIDPEDIKDIKDAISSLKTFKTQIITALVVVQTVFAIIYGVIKLFV